MPVAQKQAIVYPRLPKETLVADDSFSSSQFLISASSQSRLNE